MRKLLLCALVCAFLCGAACAEGTAYGSLNGARVFSVKYDDAFFKLDTESYLDTGNKDTFWQFMLYSDQIYIDCNIDDYGKDISLFEMSESEIDEYGRGLVDIFRGYTGKYTGIRYVRVSDGKHQAKLPFVTLTFSRYGEPDGYYAETVAHGYCIWFDCEREGMRVSDWKAQELLETLIDSFAPIL